MSDYLFSFEKLRVWQDARLWVGSVYGLTKTFPTDERFAMTSQLNRSANSVAANLAEGSGRTSLKDQAHFSQLAYGSLMESACHIILARDQHYVTDIELQQQRSTVASLANQINSLRNSQLARQ